MGRSRQAKRYLLDARFQLKWTGYLVIVVLAVMTSLGVLIARMANRSAETAQIAVTQAEKAFKESQTNNILARGAVEMAQPDNAALASVMNEQLKEVDAKQEQNLAEVRRLHDDIARDRRSLQLALGSSGVALLVLLSLMGSSSRTASSAGPQAQAPAAAREHRAHVVDERLRRGDELGDLFETFLQMTHSLRAMQNARIATLDATLRRAEATHASLEVVEGLRALRAQMMLGLEKRQATIPPTRVA